MRVRVVMLALSVVTFACFAGGPASDFNIPEFDRNKTGAIDLDESGLNAIEKRINAIIIPEIDLRGANIVSVVNVLDAGVPKWGTGAEKSDNSRVRIMIDETSLGERQPAISFANRKVPLLYGGAPQNSNHLKY